MLLKTTRFLKIIVGNHWKSWRACRRYAQPAGSGEKLFQSKSIVCFAFSADFRIVSESNLSDPMKMATGTDMNIRFETLQFQRAPAKGFHSDLYMAANAGVRMCGDLYREPYDFLRARCIEPLALLTASDFGGVHTLFTLDLILGSRLASRAAHRVGSRLFVGSSRRTRTSHIPPRFRITFWHFRRLNRLPASSGRPLCFPLEMSLQFII